MGMKTTFTVTDKTGQTRTIRRGEFIAVERGRETLGLHLNDVEKQASGRVYLKGDGVLLDAAFCRFITPDTHPAPGRQRMTFRHSGEWVEADSRNFLSIMPRGFEHMRHQRFSEDDVTVDGSPATIIPHIRTFGRLEEDGWLASKQYEESHELRAATDLWLRAQTDERRTAMLDELADLLQTVANMCAAYHIGTDELEDALDRCWEKNMRREQADEHGLRPNMRVRDKRNGRIYTTLPSDKWKMAGRKDLTGVYANDWQHPCWILTDMLEPVDSGKETA